MKMYTAAYFLTVTAARYLTETATRLTIRPVVSSVTGRQISRAQDYQTASAVKYGWQATAAVIGFKRISQPLKRAMSTEMKM